MPRPITKNQLADFWVTNYASTHCTLCGNTGIVDTRGARTPAGLLVGRLNWCVCPNGRAMASGASGLPTPGDLDAMRR